MIRDFLLFGKLTENIQVGKKIIAQDKNLELILEQEGDIPALYRFLYTNLVFEVSCIEEIIIGISFKFDDNPKKNVFFNDKKHNIKFKSKMSLKKLTNYIAILECNWEIDKVNTRDKTLGLMVGKNANIMYNLDSHHFGMFQIIFFDQKLYTDLSN